VGYPSRRFYCGENDDFGFERHPGYRELDEKFKGFCRIANRKSEAAGNIKGLTKKASGTIDSND